MGLILPMITLVTVILLVNHAAHVESEPRALAKADAASYLAPTSFEERRNRRKRALKVGTRGQPQALPQEATDSDLLMITVPNCIEEGTVLMQGHDNYFVKCINNPKTGGFFRVVYVCPKEMRSVADTSMCIPPAESDCSSCNGGGGAEDFGTNGLV
ncbi:unnamed protein product [Orchesella dallaii]|uniref:Secreted protein n=1 Tax=Orchesella dallaii TaxID=48710 RepID=A0ABP1PQK9_9HEXA